MQLQFGQYRFPIGQVEATPRMRTLRAQDGTPYEYQWSITIKGELLAADPDAATATYLLCQEAQRMRLALQNPNSDMVLIDNTGAPTDIALYRANSLGGVQVEWVQYPDTEPGALVTHRGFEFQAVAQYPATQVPNPLLEYEETVQITGNCGPQYVFQPSLVDLPTVVQTQANTTCRAIVSGRAVAYRGYPAIPPPLFGGPGVFLLNPQQAVNTGAPRWNGRMLTNFPVSWNYVFESVRPLSGLPRVWGGRSQ